MGPSILIAAVATQLAPVDQCTGDRSFAAFRSEMAKAVAEKNSAAVLGMLDTEVLVDFGGSQGPQTFKARWKLDDPRSSPLWTELTEMLGLGCALSGQVRVIPSMVEQIDDDPDAFETMLVVKPGALVRSEPRDDSKEIARLRWDVLTLGDGPTSDGWYPVRLADGRDGFLRQENVRSPLDYRMTIERVGGEWKITSFVAGD